jgi:hypothetical protein
MSRALLVVALTLAGSLLGASAGVAAVPSLSKIVFGGRTSVPPAVQEFAWQVITTRCDYQAWDRKQRSFSAYDVTTRTLEAGVSYSINIMTIVPWQQKEPPAFIEMTIVDDGRPRLTALKSSFVQCTPAPRSPA